MSQVTQTEDDGSTYMQYNVIDKNIPLFNDREIENRIPERPPRSPRNSNVVTTKVIPSKTTKTTSDRSIRDDHGQRNETIPPVHRYYLGEDPFGGSIYGRERGYKDAKRPTRNRFVSKTGGAIETEYR